MTIVLLDQIKDLLACRRNKVFQGYTDTYKDLPMVVPQVAVNRNSRAGKEKQKVYLGEKLNFGFLTALVVIVDDVTNSQPLVITLITDLTTKLQRDRIQIYLVTIVIIRRGCTRLTNV